MDTMQGSGGESHINKTLGFILILRAFPFQGEGMETLSFRVCIQYLRLFGRIMLYIFIMYYSAYQGFQKKI